MRRSDFDVTEPAVALRLLCGLFYAPHILFKLANMAGSAAFFGRVLPHGELMLYMALAAETACLIGLTFDVMVKWLGLVSAGVMGIAIYATLMTKGAGWLWNLGGVEYLAFWGLGSVALAIHAWKREWQRHGRFFLLAPA